jgi:hypothetical protein
MQHVLLAVQLHRPSRHILAVQRTRDPCEEDSMNIRRSLGLATFSIVSWLVSTTIASAGPFFFSTGNVNGQFASATRPDSAAFEIETGDDFIISTSATAITRATFTGLLVGADTTVTNLILEMYRVFPLDSDVGRTSGPPTFSTPEVPTRVNSPSDVALDSRDLSDLSFTTNVLNPSFSVNNSLQPGGIHPFPNQTTGGDGPLTGQEVEFTVNINTPFVLQPDHYFFVPQVQLANGEFLWLSSVRPIVAPGTPFAPDLQAWARDAMLQPDWLRIGTDIVGGNPAPTFNMQFTLDGEEVAVPEPATLALFGLGLSLVLRRRLAGNRGKRL